MSLLQNSNAISAGGYDINNSLRIRLSASAYLSRTFSTSQTDARKITISFWMKRGSTIGSGTNQTIITGYNGSSPGASGIGIQNDVITWGFGNNSAGNDARLTTTQVFRDPSAWYHIVAVGDSTLATSTDRIKLYINGVQVTAISTYNAPNLNLSCQIGFNNGNNRIGTRWNTGSEYFDGYLTEINVIDGQALTPSSFGETDAVTGSWVAKKYTGTYGNNGYYLKFADASAATAAAIGKDSSGNGNNWTPTNISVTAGTTYDAMTDSPTLTSATVANYAVMNPLNKTTNTTLSEANLKVTFSGANGFDKAAAATMPIQDKSYWEVTDQSAAIPTYGNIALGIIAINTNLAQTFSSSTSTITFRDYDGTFYRAGTTNPAGSGAPFGAGSTNDVYMFAYDPSTTKLWAGRNGTWFNSGNPAAGTGAISTVNLGEVVPYVAGYQSGDGPVVANFGQRPFAYTPPTGYKALNTYNLPDSTIKKGNRYMDATLYTGTNTTLPVVNAGQFKPDFTWLRIRNQAYGHTLIDSVRGGNKILKSQTTDAEYVDTTDKGVTSFNSNGFTLGLDVTTGSTNYNTGSYVAWQWQAGAGTTSTNTDGAISCTVSKNTTAGFSIVGGSGNTYFGGSLGHGLGVAPAMIIYRDRANVNDWYVYHKSLTTPNNYYLYLNQTVAQQNNGSNLWNVTSTTFGSNQGLTRTGIAFCWAEIAGFSKFGSYTGNGSTDGPFIYTGFRPKYVMIKRTDTTGSWAILDTARNTYNVANTSLYADLSNAENSIYEARDYLSNGFKLRTTDANSNANGGTFIYMAFAEHPFKNANAR